jgi:hypothetical protein
MTRDEMSAVRARVVRHTDSWRFWMTIAFLALSGIVLWGIYLTQQSAQLGATTAKQQAITAARIDADYRSCVRSIPSLRSISTHVQGVNELGEILVENSRALLHTPPYAVRRANLHRLERAQRKIAAVRSFPVPTVRSCAARRRALGG